APAASSWLDATDAPYAASLPAPHQLIAEKYRIEELIGRGGMGAVYRATHVLMDKPVALKWLYPDFSAIGDTRQRFLHEARAAARIRHPNVVDVYDVGDQNGALYLVMELLEGETLEALLQRGPLPVADMLRLLTQAMRGVAAAHAKGIVHRDIKPENIFVVDDSTQPSGHNAKVVDFGVSKLGEEARRNPGLTKTGVVMGTPLYMSLEQMNGARDVDVRTDIYAFGVILYRALTGHLPFHGETIAALAVAVATHTPTAPRALRPDIPQALNDLTLKAMARRREERHATLDDLLHELAALRGVAADQLTLSSQLPAGATPLSRERLRADLVPALQEHGRLSPAAASIRQQPGGRSAPRRALWLVLVPGLLALVGIALWWPKGRSPVELRAPLPPAVPSAAAHAPPPAATVPDTADWGSRPDAPANTHVVAPVEAPAPAFDAPSQPVAISPPAAEPARAGSSTSERTPDRRAPRVDRQVRASRGLGATQPAISPEATPVPSSTSSEKAAPTHRSGGVALDEL
ncbi:MAG TPA: protein kinase, partial [Polyangiales bacterium]